MVYLHHLHEAARKEGWVAVEALVGEQETLDLDFKNKTVPDDGSLTTKDSEILAALVVAFANSMGGLAVVGVDCRPGDDGADEVQAIKPLANVRRFASLVRSNIPNFAKPRLEDVTVDYFEKPDSGGAGVLMISVGRSERRPHRCEVKGRKHYYRRSGPNTFEMEAFEIEDAYRRASVARLEFEVPQFMEAGRSDNTYERYLRFFVRNVSNQTAKFPFVRIDSLAGGKVWDFGINGNRHFPLPRIYPMEPGTFAGDVNTVIHPDQALEVFRLPFHVQVPSYDVHSAGGLPRWPQGFVPADQAHLRIELTTSCENAPPTRQCFEYKGLQLLHALGFGRNRVL